MQSESNLIKAVRIALSNAAVFLLFLLYMKLVRSCESIIPVIVVPSVIFLAAALILKTGFIHVIPGNIAVIVYAALALSSRSGEDSSASALALIVGAFIVFELLELLCSRLVRAEIERLREELSGGRDE